MPIKLAQVAPWKKPVNLNTEGIEEALTSAGADRLGKPSIELAREAFRAYLSWPGAESAEREIALARAWKTICASAITTRQHASILGRLEADLLEVVLSSRSEDLATGRVTAMDPGPALSETLNRFRKWLGRTDNPMKLEGLEDARYKHIRPVVAANILATRNPHSLEALSAYLDDNSIPFLFTNPAFCEASFRHLAGKWVELVEEEAGRGISGGASWPKTNTFGRNWGDDFFRQGAGRGWTMSDAHLERLRSILHKGHRMSGEQAFLLTAIPCVARNEAFRTRILSEAGAWAGCRTIPHLNGTTFAQSLANVATSQWDGGRLAEALRACGPGNLVDLAPGDLDVISTHIDEDVRREGQRLLSFLQNSGDPEPIKSGRSARATTEARRGPAA